MIKMEIWTDSSDEHAQLEMVTTDVHIPEKLVWRGYWGGHIPVEGDLLILNGEEFICKNAVIVVDEFDDADYKVTVEPDFNNMFDSLYNVQELRKCNLQRIHSKDGRYFKTRDKQ